MNNKESILEMNHYQDLCLQLHLYGLFTVSSLKPSWRLVPRVGTPNFKIFEGWDDIPPVVCVVVCVPRKNLGLLMNENAGSPRFQVNLMGGSSCHNNLSSLHGIWGKLARDSGNPTRLSIEEDQAGVHGTSDLIVSFWAASYLLVTADTTVCFALRLNPFAISTFMSKLGVNLELFTTSLEDKKYITILRDRPMAGTAAQRVSQLIPDVSSSEAAVGNVSCQVGIIKAETTNLTYTVTSLTVKLSIDSIDQKAKLLEGASVSAKQISPCTMEVSVAGYQHVVSYPYPINGAGHRLRIARKSHYVEIVTNLANPIGSGGYAVNPFPMIGHGSYAPWNVHHIHMDRMPLLNLKSKNKIDWLRTHCVFQVSDRERSFSESVKNNPENVMVQVKESIYTMFTHYAGLQGGPTQVFCFCDPSGSLGVYTVIIVAGVRLDLASSTVVLDAAVVPLSIGKMPVLLSGIQNLHSNGGKQVEQLLTQGAEVTAWKRLMPALVERCRTWSHTPNCEYISENKIPLSVETSFSPICSCGQGIGFTSPEWDVSWWKGLLPHATRIAISPLFAVSYIDRVGGELAQLFASQPSAQSGTPGVKKPTNACWSCGGPGRPSLAVCSRCKKAKYCSPECQRQDWKEGHKMNCGSS